MSELVDVVRVGGWEGYGWLRHGFSTRAGGVSSVYGGNSLNLGWTKEDEPGLVAENRRCFLRSVGGDLRGEAGQQNGWRMVTLRQVHSAAVRRVGDEALEGRLETAEGKAVLEGDGLITDAPGVMLAVGTADCVPVLVVDVEKRVVGAFHAGWRGTVAGITEKGVAMMRREFGSRVEDLRAAVGPGIGACCYSVGEEVRAEFGARFDYAEELFRVGGESKLYVDLWEANRRQLLTAGLGAAQIVVVGECTACARDARGDRKYFSHRAERGVAGRMLSAVGVAAS
jgi:YfiH family protein